MGIFSDWAQTYLDLGFSVIPVDRQSKGPYFKDWQRFCAEIADDKQMTKWSKEARFTEGNIGLCCGPASGVIAVDFDYTLPDVHRVEQLVRGVLPPITVAKKGQKGWTAFFKYNPEIINEAIDKEYEGETKRLVDILCEGKQTVMPPSIHSNTKKPYYWITPDTLENVSVEDLPELTPDMIKAIREISKMTKSSDYAASGTGQGRHDVIFGHVIRRIDKYKSLDDMVADMIAHDLERHSNHEKGPYFNDRNYLKGKSTTAFVTALATRMVKWRKGKLLTSGQLWELGCDSDFPSKNNGFFSIHEKTVGKEVKVFEKPEYYELADYLIKRRYFMTSEAQSFVYESGYYKQLNKLSLYNLIMELTKDKATAPQVENFYRIARGKAFVDEFEKLDTEHLINLNNGVLDIKTNKLMPHTAEYFFKYKLPHSYKAGATCETWLAFLDRIFLGRKELVDLSAEIFGYAMAGGYPWLHKAFLLYGDGRNGKSTFIDVLSFLLGKENTSGIPIDKLDKPFSVVMADGKLANITGETSNKDIDSSCFKTAVSGEELPASHKGMPEYMLPFKAKMFSACNSLPRLRDSTSGAYEKLCIVPFDYYIPAADRIPQYAKTHLFPEISGIINWAIEGYERLLERGKLQDIEAIKEVFNEYRTESDSVYTWCEIAMSVAPKDDGNRVFARERYADYLSYCAAQNLSKVTKHTFIKRVNSNATLKGEAIGRNVKDRCRYGIALRGVSFDDRLSYII